MHIEKLYLRILSMHIVEQRAKELCYIGLSVEIKVQVVLNTSSQDGRYVMTIARGGLRPTLLGRYCVLQTIDQNAQQEGILS